MVSVQESQSALPAFETGQGLTQSSACPEPGRGGSPLVGIV